MTTVTVQTSTAVVQVTSPVSATITGLGAASATVNQNQATVVSNLQQVDTIGDPSWVQFNTNATITDATGRLAWDTEWETLKLGVNSGAVLQFGQEFHILVQNDSGETIPDGVLVMAELDGNGRLRTVGQGIMRVVKANVDGSLPGKLMLGVTTTSMGNGERGMVTVNGYVNNLDTVTPGWTVGDILWANPVVAGGFTTTAPVAPNLKLPIAVVTRVQSQTGSIYVRMTNGFDLTEIHDVQITNPQEGQNLVYRSGVWVNE